MSKFSLKELAEIEGTANTMARLATVMSIKQIYAEYDATKEDGVEMLELLKDIVKILEDKQNGDI